MRPGARAEGRIAAESPLSEPTLWERGSEAAAMPRASDKHSAWPPYKASR